MSKKELNGSEIAGFIKERHKGAVRALPKQPCLAIVRTNSDPVIDIYLKIKQAYARDIGAKVEVTTTTEAEAQSVIDALNSDSDVHGIIVQLPLADSRETDRILSIVEPAKDVDGLGRDALYMPATPTAILWLLASYNIDLRGKRVLVIGQGRLVGKPLAEMLKNSDVDVKVADITTKNLPELCMGSDIIITAVGKPSLINSSMVPKDAVIIDAGTATEDGMVQGDVADDVREREDIIISPKNGGVGPLTVSALFENLLSATRKSL